MALKEKILSKEQLQHWRQQVRDEGRTLVVTNGCFDLLHAGHVTYLDEAKQQGDLLLLGLNSDRSVRELKGPSRPVNSEGDRATVMAALESVNAVHIFDETTALQFLKQVEPDVYVKGGDYTIDTINQEERAAVENAGGRIVILGVLEGRSTTNTLKKLGSE